MESNLKWQNLYRSRKKTRPTSKYKCTQIWIDAKAWVMWKFLTFKMNLKDFLSINGL